jgi:hypothetical protein
LQLRTGAVGNWLVLYRKDAQPKKCPFRSSL